MKSKAKSVFTCQNCGAQRPKWQGQCSDCGKWNSFLEENYSEPLDPHQGRGWAIGKPKAEKSGPELKTRSLDKDFSVTKVHRISTGLSEVNRVLGGGLVPGSFVLLGGDPGIGKSTLLMQLAGGLAHEGHSLVYVSAEENVEQTGMRAQRLGVTSSLVHVGSESNLDVILDIASSHKPTALVVDSIQTVFLPHINSAPGTVSQVRECAGHLMTLAKNAGISIIIVGHVTKDGQIAGPKVLEHMVDTVLSFEGDMSQQFRILRSMKNRFGPTHDLGVFQMLGTGLKEITNPSELFLEEREEGMAGSAVFASMEGSRPLLCEIQALTTGSPLAMPRRTAIGCDLNRLHLLTAVLEKHTKVNLSHRDIYVSVVGGLKLIEPATDLAIAAALASSEFGRPMTPKTCLFGEIGLTGEVRAVSFPEIRIKEASKLGFERFIVPRANQKHLEVEGKNNQIIWISNIRELESKLVSRDPSSN